MIYPFAKAQQYAIGTSLFGTDWAYWGGGQYVALDAELEYSVVVDGSDLIYEIGVTMFEWYGGRTERRPWCVNWPRA